MNISSMILHREKRSIITSIIDKDNSETIGTSTILLVNIFLMEGKVAGKGS